MVPNRNASWGQAGDQHLQKTLSICKHAATPHLAAEARMVPIPETTVPKVDIAQGIAATRMERVEYMSTTMATPPTMIVATIPLHTSTLENIFEGTKHRGCAGCNVEMKQAQTTPNFWDY
jgi:hypothetical protein